MGPSLSHSRRHDYRSQRYFPRMACPRRSPGRSATIRGSPVVTAQACNTGVGKNLTGEGVMGLGRADLRQAGYEHPFFWAPFILVGEP